MIFLTAAIRAAMARHQGLPARRPARPLWRLLVGELRWAAQQLLARPWVLAGLVVGSVGSLLVLGTSAPGPVAEPQWRVIISVAVGWLLGMGGRFVPTGRARERGGTGEGRPLVAVTVVASSVVAVTLLVWLLAWVGTLFG